MPGCEVSNSYQVASEGYYEVKENHNDSGCANHNEEQQEYYGESEIRETESGYLSQNGGSSESVSCKSKDQDYNQNLEAEGYYQQEENSACQKEQDHYDDGAYYAEAEAYESTSSGCAAKEEYHEVVESGCQKEQDHYDDGAYYAEPEAYESTSSGCAKNDSDYYAEANEYYKQEEESHDCGSGYEEEGSGDYYQQVDGCEASKNESGYCGGEIEADYCQYDNGGDYYGTSEQAEASDCSAGSNGYDCEVNASYYEQDSGCSGGEVIDTYHDVQVCETSDAGGSYYYYDDAAQSSTSACLAGY